MGFLKDIVNALSNPYIFVPLVTIVFFLTLPRRRIWTRKGGLVALLGALLFFALSLFDANFRAIVTKADNVPIVFMIFLVGFFVWFSLKQGMENDDRVARGEPVKEKPEFEEKVLVWPHLVYIELIALVIMSIILIVWAIGLSAPLEQPANPSVAPNPSKAPWYFLGLQEMLVYFDPWLAGVVFPGLIIVGLMAIPYLDKNPKGNGYYTFRERRFAITWFLFGFIILWVVLITIGTFLRGPNWNFFGPYEAWDIHKLVALTNVNLSEYIYVKLLGIGLPKHWLVRELFGILIVLAYLFVLPPLLAKTLFKGFYQQLGTVRYHILVLLFLLMMSMPIKMLARWLFNLKYVIAIPEFFFNI